MKTKINIDRKSARNYAIVLVVGLVFGWIFFGISESKDEAIHEHIEQADESTTWTCSMHPQIKQDKPGQCPICGMDLIPLASTTGGDAHINPNEVQLSEAALKLADVQTMQVQKDYSNKELHLLGKVKPDERNIAEITARFGGRIEKLYVNFTGQDVRRGERLASIYSPELLTAQKELLETLEYKDSNPAFYKATRSKLKLWDLTDAQINSIEEGGEPQTYFNIMAPISGTVTTRHVAVGDYVKEGNPLFRVIDLSKVWIMFEAYESDLPWLKEGDKVTFTVQSLPGKTYTGNITQIDPFLDAATRVAKVRVEVSNPNQELKPEMFANGIVKSRISGNEKDLLIPKTAVLWTGKRSVVYVKMEDRERPSFLYREITLGPEAGDFYIVEEGLEEGEEIAVNGVFKIDAAAQLEGKKSMMNPDGGQVATGHDHGGTDMEEDQEAEDHSGHDMAGHEGDDMSKTSFHVSGNCEMCKSTIEKAAKGVEGVMAAKWDVETKELDLSYNSNKANIDDIHQAIAASGYDTEKETAPKEAYDKLPPCCKYTRAPGEASKPNLEQANFKVAGNCEMCKNTIEKAAKGLEGVNAANWNIETKEMNVSYNHDKVSLDKIHKAIASAGYDTEKETAPKAAYEDLPPCCKYTRE